MQYNTGATSNGLIGLSALNISGLSALRTLTLLDSQRVVGSNYNGVVDISQMPQMLIQRIDVVTGGASASWGSDAIAGVVNFVTEKKFEGFKMNAVAGCRNTATWAMSPTRWRRAPASGGRGHAEVSAEYSYYNDGLCRAIRPSRTIPSRKISAAVRSIACRAPSAGGNGRAPAGSRIRSMSAEKQPANPIMA